MIPQLFSFHNASVRIIKDDEGNVWFAAKDECDILGITWNGKKTLASIKEEWQMVVKVPTISGAKPMIFINEAALYKLAFRSNKPEAEAFTDWVAGEVLPSLRKTGSYRLADYLQAEPRSWSQTYPDRYFENVLRLYGYSFQKGTNPPQFVGHFTNEFVYRALDKQMPVELKRRQGETLDEQRAYMHQFLNSDGRHVLEKHLTRVVVVMEHCATIDQFKKMWESGNARRSGQLELYLR